MFLGFCLPASNVHAAHAAVERLTDSPVEQLIAVENGSVERVRLGEQTIWRWRIETGQTSRLSIRRDHPLFGRLRYYDRLQMQYRIASGEIHSLELNALGHVTGPRQHKVHNFRIAITTTPREVWHHEELDLARPYWFPWDTPDGEGEEGYFQFKAMALVPGTVIERTWERGSVRAWEREMAQSQTLLPWLPRSHALTLSRSSGG